MVVFILGCNATKIPSERYKQYEYYKSIAFENNQLKIDLKNPLHCPLRIWVFDDSNYLQATFDEINPIELGSKSDTLLVFSNIHRFEDKIHFSSLLGSTSKQIETIKIELPFPRNKKYRIIQGNNTDHTHNTDYSKYAVDFHLKIKDTICAATSGFVVGVIDKYKHGGKGNEWEPFGNYITIYDPRSGIFTQYVHLVMNGSLVKIGDEIKSGQPIALSGNTGQSDIAHLHFNCLIPVNSNDGLKSIPFESIEGYKSEELKKNDIVKK
jgi:murein DD-endopeptidase MepM/ murein hydrolase activator NlpD